MPNELPREVLNEPTRYYARGYTLLCGNGIIVARLAERVDAQDLADLLNAMGAEWKAERKAREQAEEAVKAADALADAVESAEYVGDTCDDPDCYSCQMTRTLAAYRTIRERKPKGGETQPCPQGCAYLDVTECAFGKDRHCDGRDPSLNAPDQETAKTCPTCGGTRQEPLRLGRKTEYGYHEKTCDDPFHQQTAKEGDGQ